MFKRMIAGIPAIVLALALSLLFAAPALAQQDTTSTRPGMMRRGMMRGMMQGQGMMQRGMMPDMRHMGADHVGPAMLLELKSELELSDQQVGQLTKIREDHHALMQGFHENATDLRERLATARAADDYSALERLIDERAELGAKMAKSHLNVERQTIGVLNDAQRQQLETWKEGARLFRRGHMRHRQMQPGPGMQQGPPPGPGR